MAKADKKKRSVKPSGKSGPHLAVAVLAEKVLLEPDGAATIVRIVDRIYFDVMPEVPLGNPLSVSNLVVVVSLRSGGIAGKCSIAIVPVSPSGKVGIRGVSEPEFDGRPGATANIQIPFLMIWEGPGLYWFEVFVDEQCVSRIPVTVIIGKPGSDKSKK